MKYIFNNNNKTINIIANIFLALLCIAIIALAIFISTLEYQNQQNFDITVADKYIKKIDDKDTYIVVDTNGNSYQISDLFFIWKFNSTDLYNKLTIGQSYNITTSSYRTHFLSWYPNINQIN